MISLRRTQGLGVLSVLVCYRNVPFCLCFPAKARVRDVKFCKMENRIASVSVDGFMRLWDPERLQCVYEVQLGLGQNALKM